MFVLVFVLELGVDVPALVALVISLASVIVNDPLCAFGSR